LERFKVKKIKAIDTRDIHISFAISLLKNQQRQTKGSDKVKINYKKAMDINLKKQRKYSLKT
jgi:hypothetical protein